MKTNRLLTMLLVGALFWGSSQAQIPELPGTTVRALQKNYAPTSQKFRRNAQNFTTRTRSQPPEDWIQTGSAQASPLVLQQGFSYVSDSLIWAAPVDIGPLIGVPGNPNKIISRSTDGGMTWEPVTIELPDSSLTFTADSALTPVFIEAINDTLIWVCMDAVPAQNYGALLKSEDGGITWAKVELPLSDSAIFPFCLHFFDADTGVAFANGFPPVVPTPVQIFYTEDGGDTWADVSIPLDSAESRWFSQVDALHDVQGDTIWYGTRHGRILRSINRGKDWEVFETGLGPFNNISSIAFRDALNGLACISVSPTENIIPSVVVRTTDGGETWEQIPTPSFIEHVFYVEGSGGVYIGANGAFGRPGFVISKDDGNTWTYDIPTFGGATFFFPRPDFGFLGEINSNGGIYKYVGPPLVFDDTQSESLLFEGQATGILPNGSSLYDLDAVDQEVIWAVANEGRAFTFPVAEDHSPAILKSTDGGESWEYKVAEEITGWISFDIHAFGPDTAWMTTQNFDSVSSDRGLWATFDGGETWTEKLLAPAGGVWQHFFDRQEGIVINRQGIRKTLDGGETWTLVDSAAIPLFDSTEFTVIFNGTNSFATVEDHMWFGTTQGRIFKTTDRGNTWVAIQASPDSSQISTLAFSDTLNGLAVVSIQGFSPRFSTIILRTADGGQTWTALPPFVKPIFSLEYVPGTENTFIAGGRADQFLAYTLDGGETWIFAPDIAPFDGIDFVSPESGWIANNTFQGAANPAVLKYIGEPFPAATSVSRDHLLQGVSVKVFPNPTSEFLTVESEKAIQNISLIDLQGRKTALSTSVNRKAWSGSLPQVAAGHYWLELHIAGKLIYKLIEIQ